MGTGNTGYVVRDGRGWTWKANGRDNEGRFDFLVVDHLAYASGPPLHIHAAREDTFFIIDGVLTLQLDDEVVELGPGHFATAPPGVAHSFTNARPDQGVCREVNLMTPGIGFDRYIEGIDQLASSGDEESMERLNAEFGVTFVGPSRADRLGLLPV